jgi:DNA-binding GntR family transcriptional regulator
MDMKVIPQGVQAQAVRMLREAIISGHFEPGEHLIEADLCTRLGVSRPSVREALRSLEAERLVVMMPNRGPMIPVLTLDEAREIYYVRAMLEGEAASLAASRVTAAATARMKLALDAFDQAVKANDAAALVTTTRAFYQEIFDSCGNRIIAEVASVLTDRVTFLRSKSMSLKGRPHQSSEEMRAIWKALAARDPEAARSAAVDHVWRARDAASEAYSTDAARREAGKDE